MKNCYLTLVLFFITFTSYAQEFKFGWKIGIGVASGYSKVGTKIEKGAKSFDLNLDHSKRDFSAGLYGSLKLGSFYIAPELLINTFKVDYQLKGPSITGIDTLKSDLFVRGDIPFMLGYRAGKSIFIKAGPVAHFHLSGKSDLSSIDGFKATYTPFELGYQYGIAIAFSKKTQLDFRFDRYLKDFGQHINIDNTPYPFFQKFRRAYIGLAFAF
jgi:Outer membrane protein beta-barrel domain